MMQQMIDFSVAYLDALADFLGREPVFYLWVLVLLLFIVRVFQQLTR